MNRDRNCAFDMRFPVAIAAPPESYFAKRSGALSLTIRRLKSSRDTPMNTLPVDRAMRIYSTLANRFETKGARERLSKHLMKKYIGRKRRTSLNGARTVISARSRETSPSRRSAVSTAALFSPSRRGPHPPLLVFALVVPSCRPFLPLASWAELALALSKRARQVAFSSGQRLV
jgi:hypothetical protein